MEENNVFTGKTREEAENNACLALGLTREELETEVLEEGKKKLFGSVKWKIRATRKVSDGVRAARYVEGLLNEMGVKAECTAEEEEDLIKLLIDAEDSKRVIGKHGEVLEAIQCLAGAVANIGRDKYVKVSADCRNYRKQRDEALADLAHRAAKKAMETGRKVMLNPMNPYERRIIHSTLGGSGVKTLSAGKEPMRYVEIIPENVDENARPIKFGATEKRGRGQGGHAGGNGNGKRGSKPFRKNDRRSKPASGEKRAKKEIRFGTYLGNSGDAGKEE